MLQGLTRGTLAGRAEAGSSGRGDALKEESEVGEGRMGERKGERGGKEGREEEMETKNINEHFCHLDKS